MKLRGIEYGGVFFAPGTFGYFGEKKSLSHKFFLRRSVFISKTTTIFPYSQPRAGNKKKKIVKKIGAGVILSAEDISGPGFESLVNTGKWQKRKNPFFISVCFMENSPKEKIVEVRKVVKILEKRKKEFKADFGLFVCVYDPVDGDYFSLKNQTAEILEILSILELPLVVEVSPSFPPDMASELASDTNCNAIALRGTVAWDDMQNEAKEVFFRTQVSTLSRAQKGGFVFGKYVAPLSCEWLRQAKKFMLGKNLIGGGGILNGNTALSFAQSGATGIVLDRANFLRPWNIQKILRKAKKLFQKK